MLIISRLPVVLSHLGTLFAADGAGFGGLTICTLYPGVLKRFALGGLTDGTGLGMLASCINPDMAKRDSLNFAADGAGPGIEAICFLPFVVSHRTLCCSTDSTGFRCLTVCSFPIMSERFASRFFTAGTDLRVFAVRGTKVMIPEEAGRKIEDQSRGYQHKDNSCCTDGNNNLALLFSFQIKVRRWLAHIRWLYGRRIGWNLSRRKT